MTRRSHRVQALFDLSRPISATMPAAQVPARGPVSECGEGVLLPAGHEFEWWRGEWMSGWVARWSWCQLVALRLAFAFTGLALACAAPISQAQQRREREPNSAYAARRARLAAEVDAPIVLWGFSGREESSQAYVFAQEENFYYLTGHNEEGAALIILPAGKAASEGGGTAPASDFGNATLFSSRKRFRQGKMERHPHVAVRSGHRSAHRLLHGKTIQRTARQCRKAGQELSWGLHHSSV